MNFPAFVAYAIILAVAVLAVGQVARLVYKRKGRSVAVLTFVMLAPITFFLLVWAWLIVAMWIAISLGKFAP